MFKIAFILALLGVGFMAGLLIAANTNSEMPIVGLPITFSTDGDTATVDEIDPGTNAYKRAAVIACVVSGQAVKQLVRVQKASNGLFIDIVTDDVDADLDTRVGSMNLSARSHPSPTEDAIDTAILVAAAAD